MMLSAKEAWSQECACNVQATYMHFLAKSSPAPESGAWAARAKPWSVWGRLWSCSQVTTTKHVLRSAYIVCLSETTGAPIRRIVRVLCRYSDIWSDAFARVNIRRAAESDQRALLLIERRITNIETQRRDTCRAGTRGHMKQDAFMCGEAMVVSAADAWSIARFCALVAEDADDDVMCRSLINIRDVWINIANECELLAGRVEVEPREQVAVGARRLRLVGS